MSVLGEAVNNLQENCLQALKSIQQVLKILWNHLETYNKRYFGVIQAVIIALILVYRFCDFQNKGFRTQSMKYT